MPCPPPKYYVDRAVQTDPRLSYQSPTSCETHSLLLEDSVDEPAISRLGLANEDLRPGNLGYESAYIQSPTSKITNSVSLLHSRQERKQPAIGSGYPSTAALPPKRVVSLPSASPAGTVLTILEKQIRIVSMPERGKLGTLGSHKLSLTDQVDNTSTDITYYSVDSTNGRPSREYDAERPYPPDVPQTPSPPSSPDSVMIIGNEGHVSGSFLRRSYTDENGWITWASSPPRPIPALHGPLSLPYARCPSGAEGTVIEGDDLSHKIWGLGIDDVQSQPRSSKTSFIQVQPLDSSGNSTTMQFHQNNPENGGETHIPAFQRQRDAVIDLSKPSTFRGRMDVSGIPQRHASALGNTHSIVPSSTINEDVQFETSRFRGDLDHNRSGPLENGNHLRQTLPVDMTHGTDSMSNPLGLGLNWNGVFGHETRNTSAASRTSGDRHNRLNIAASIFVPSSATGPGRLSRTPYTRHAEETKTSVSSSQHVVRQPVFDIAQQYRPRHDHLLPTPPSTASPRWSPVFLQHNEREFSNKMVPRHGQQGSIYQAPKVYSPHSDIDDYSGKLAAMIEQLGGHEFDYPAERFSPVQNFTAQQIRLPASGRYGPGNLHFHSTPQPISQNNIVDTPFVNQEIVTKDEELEQPDALVANPYFSLERRRNLSYQHPRSIPLARLIQRRLSSVAEEDASIGRDNVLPLLHKKFPNSYFKHFSPETSDSRYSMKLESVTSREIIDTTADADQDFETTVSMEGAPVEESDAVVRLPPKTTSLLSNQLPSTLPQNKRHPLSDSGHGKENDDGRGISTSASSTSNKVRNKSRKRSGGAPVRHTSLSSSRSHKSSIRALYYPFF